MDKIEWIQIDENEYNCYYKNEYIGLMNRKDNYLWYLIIPKYNIIKEGQYRNDLIEYAEIQFEKYLINH